MSAGSVGPGYAPASQSHTSGNLLVVCVRYFKESGQVVNSITDTAGNTYTLAVAVTNNINDYLGIYYAKNITGHASNVVTVNFSATVRFVSVQVLQYSGCDTTSPLDTTASSNTQYSGSYVTGSFTTSQANEVLVSTVQIGSTTSSFTVGSGYTQRALSTSSVHLTQEKIVSSIQTSVTAGATNTNTTNGGHALVATFKEAPEVRSGKFFPFLMRKAADLLKRAKAGLWVPDYSY